MATGESFEPRFETFDANGVKLHCAIAGDTRFPLIICLHGFPEFWVAWRPVMADLAADFHVVVPDQRGFNLSSKPAGPAAYRVRNMVEDVAALADRLSPGRNFILAGHDWGASVAYAFAFVYPQRLSHLIVVNGVHPVCFQRAIVDDPAQRQASQYFRRLCAPDAAERMREDNFARPINMIRSYSRTSWMTPEIQAQYRAAWAQPGAVETMLQWYSSSPIVVPAIDEGPGVLPLLQAPPAAMRVPMPHLVIWGDGDEALQPSCLKELNQFAPDLAVKHIHDAGHWVLHERPREVAEAIRAFTRNENSR